MVDDAKAIRLNSSVSSDLVTARVKSIASLSVSKESSMFSEKKLSFSLAATCGNSLHWSTVCCNVYKAADDEQTLPKI